MNTTDNTSWLASQAGQELNATLSQDQTLHALNRLLLRIDTLEQSVDRLSSLMEQGPGMVSMVTDMADEAMHSAGESGVDVETRIGSLLHLLNRLTQPQTMAKLEGLLALTDQLPGMASMFTDLVDEQIHQAREKGVDFESRLQTASTLLSKLTSPQMAGQLDQLMALADQGPGLLAMLVDMVDDSMQSELTEQAKNMLNPKALAVLGKTGDALIKTQKEEIPKVGMRGLFRALKNEDMQRAMGFLVNFGKNFGKNITQ